MRLRPINSPKKEQVVTYLTKHFFKEYEEVMQGFKPEEQLKLNEHFILMMDNLFHFASEIGNKTAAKFADEYAASVDALLVKYGSSLKTYIDKEFIQYFLPPLVLVCKGFYSQDEVERKENEALNIDDAKAFAFLCKSQLQQIRKEMLLNNMPFADDGSVSNKESKLDSITNNAAITKEGVQKYLPIVESKLTPFKDSFTIDSDFQKAIETIAQFLDSGKTYEGELLFVKGGIIKKLAFALGEIWRSSSNDIISAEYLRLYTQLFSVFSKFDIDDSNIFSNNLSKYSISKT